MTTQYQTLHLGKCNQFDVPVESITDVGVSGICHIRFHGTVVLIIYLNIPSITLFPHGQVHKHVNVLLNHPTPSPQQV